MTRAKDIAKIRRLLQRRRRDVLITALAANREVEALKGQEHDPEYEESAQTELADYTLSHLVESHRREMMLIDAALQRMDARAFGKCTDCDQQIPYERLLALPFALRCEECAEHHESEAARSSAATATPSL